MVVRFMLRWPMLLMFLQRVWILLSTLVNGKNAGINIIIRLYFTYTRYSYIILFITSDSEKNCYYHAGWIFAVQS
jgi:hypothetical protein